jgi:hypothetical protein
LLRARPVHCLFCSDVPLGGEMIINGRDDLLIEQHDERILSPPSSTEHGNTCSEVKLREQSFIVLVSSVGSCRRKSCDKPAMRVIIKNYWHCFQS